MWESLILAKIDAIPALAYSLIFVGMVIEGEAFLIAGIFSAYAGYLDMLRVFQVAFLGMFIGDILWYWAGPHIEKYLIPKKFLPFIAIVDRQLQKRPVAMVFTAKFVYFFHRLVLARSHPAGVPFKKYLKADISAVIVWLFTTFILASALALSFEALRRYIRFAEIGVLAAIIAFAVGEHYLGKYVRKRLESSSVNEK